LSCENTVAICVLLVLY